MKKNIQLNIKNLIIKPQGKFWHICQIQGDANFHFIS